MIAESLGSQVIDKDSNDETLELATALGETKDGNVSKSSNVVEEVRELTHGGAHVSLDALGSQTTCFNSVANLRKRGKHIQVGLMTGNHQHPKVPMDKVLANELEILGSHGIQAFRYSAMLEMIKEGKLQPEKLVERTISLEEVIVELPNMDKFTNKGILVVDSF